MANPVLLLIASPVAASLLAPASAQTMTDEPPPHDASGCLLEPAIIAINPDVRTNLAEQLLDFTATPELFQLSLGVLPDTEDDSTDAEEDAWRVDLTTWIWAVGMTGDTGARGFEASFDVDFIDVLEASDSIFAYSGRLEFARGRVGGFVDGMYAKLGVDDASGSPGLVDIDITAEIGVVDFGLMYRVGEWAPQGDAAKNKHKTTLDVYAGARYFALDLDLDPANLGSRSRSGDWIDPIIGAKLTLPLSEELHLVAMGDVGGFGVESDLTWSATAVIGYDFRCFDHPASLYGGYRAFGHDISEGPGFAWDVIMHGPIVGLTIEF